jgi:zinc transporter 1/2/3
MFANKCLGDFSHQYGSIATAITMAGAFIAFLVDYICHRLAHWRSVSTGPESQGLSPQTTEKAVSDATSVLILEVDIIFHSLLLGITLVIVADSFFMTLFIVVIFHQMFQGLTLGARIAGIDTTTSSRLIEAAKYVFLPLAYAVMTSIGMALGIWGLLRFNGDDPSSIIALGTLDGLSAGILLWVGFVNMLAGDWLFGELKHASMLITFGGLASLVAGMALMASVGTWAGAVRA